MWGRRKGVVYFTHAKLPFRLFEKKWYLQLAHYFRANIIGVFRQSAPLRKCDRSSLLSSAQSAPLHGPPDFLQIDSQHRQRTQGKVLPKPHVGVAVKISLTVSREKRSGDVAHTCQVAFMRCQSKPKLPQGASPEAQKPHKLTTKTTQVHYKNQR